MLIHILRGPDERGIRVEDDVEESLLEKKEEVVENDDEYTTAVEYRFPDSDVIVHRSCHVTLKKRPAGLDGILQHISLDGWAQDLIARLMRQREETGKPVELKGRFTPAEQEALARELARMPNVGTLTMENSQ